MHENPQGHPCDLHRGDLSPGRRYPDRKGNAASPTPEAIRNIHFKRKRRKVHPMSSIATISEVCPIDNIVATLSTPSVFKEFGTIRIVGGQGNGEEKRGQKIDAGITVLQDAEKP